MADVQGRVQLVFNGEIYNHRELREVLEADGHKFRTSSDTEVLIESYLEWGFDCIGRLNGMFSFALFDSEARHVLVARDRVGEKPLFYHHSAERFSFASELKALMAAPNFERRLDLSALEYYLTLGYVPGDKCMLHGVRKLPAAHALVYKVSLDQVRVWRYWDLPEPSLDESPDPETLTDELEALLRDSVRRQLVADVPVGVLLSGGVDSSLITALAAQESTRALRTFTITFPGWGGYDEAPHARSVADYFGTVHQELVADAASVDLVPLLARQYDEPMYDSSMIPTYLVCRMIRENATVALGGDGGDELFGGYLLYQQMIQQAKLRELLPAFARAAIALSAAYALPLGMRGRHYLIGLGGTATESVVHAAAAFDTTALRRLFIPLREGRVSSDMPPLAYRSGLCRPEWGLPGMAMALDFRTYLCDDILVKVDRASMLASLEVRAPMLDHRIVEFAFKRIPNDLRTTAAARKVLLQRVAERHLPPGLNLKRKQGFAVPLSRWINGEWGPLVKDILTEAEPSLFDRRQIRGMLSGMRKGRSNAGRIFMLTLFELWRREYRVGVG